MNLEIRRSGWRTSNPKAIVRCYSGKPPRPFARENIGVDSSRLPVIYFVNRCSAPWGMEFPTPKPHGILSWKVCLVRGLHFDRKGKGMALFHLHGRAKE